ncbi:MAG: hypothetical protein GX443_13290 [Deltaproteobacteria bacterium]|nr:hypothetical protein [Deltaproteobacteria bacterium]
MSSDALRYFLFPQTIACERNLRLFARLFPAFTLLRVLRLPCLPDWGGDPLRTWPAITNAELLEAVRGSYRAYQDYAALHGEESGLAAISHERIAGELEESRFRIQSILRGREAATSPQEDAGRMLVEAAVFLEMARDLDERQMELEAGISQVDRLEHEFREILGISGEEELQEIVETVTPPLVPSEMASFRLPLRMAYWLRLFHGNLPEGFPIFVTESKDVPEEALDALNREFKREQRAFELLQVELGSIPPTGHTGPTHKGGLDSPYRPHDPAAAFSRVLEDFLRNPQEAPVKENVQSAWHDLTEAAFGKETDGPGEFHEGRLFSWVLVAGATVGDLWRSLDHPGTSALSATAAPHPAPLAFLVAGRLEVHDTI